MIFIKQIPNGIINLEGVKEYNWNFQVITKNKNGKDQSFFISYISNDAISVETVGLNGINISIDVKNILQDEYFQITTINGETMLVTVKPNTSNTEEKIYRFELTKSEVIEKGSLKIRLLSKVNKKEIGWKCTYEGKPISYEITPLEKDKSGFVTIKLLSNLFVRHYDSSIIFTQNESEKTITLNVRAKRDGSIEILK